MDATRTTAVLSTPQSGPNRKKRAEGVAPQPAAIFLYIDSSTNEPYREAPAPVLHPGEDKVTKI